MAAQASRISVINLVIWMGVGMVWWKAGRPLVGRLSPLQAPIPDTIACDYTGDKLMRPVKSRSSFLLVMVLGASAVSVSAQQQYAPRRGTRGEWRRPGDA